MVHVISNVDCNRIMSVFSFQIPAFGQRQPCGCWRTLFILLCNHKRSNQWRRTCRRRVWSCRHMIMNTRLWCITSRGEIQRWCGWVIMRKTETCEWCHYHGHISATHLLFFTVAVCLVRSNCEHWKSRSCNKSAGIRFMDFYRNRRHCCINPVLAWMRSLGVPRCQTLLHRYRLHNRN